MSKGQQILKETRYKLCLSQREFAQMLGISHTTYSYYETGKRHPHFTIIRKIVDKLKEKGISMEYSDLIED